MLKLYNCTDKKDEACSARKVCNLANNLICEAGKCVCLMEYQTWVDANGVNKCFNSSSELYVYFLSLDCLYYICTLREESIQTNVILQYKLLTAILSAVCSVI